MPRLYVNLSLVYALLGMAAGVFYREYTKFSGFAAVSYTHLTLPTNIVV